MVACLPGRYHGDEPRRGCNETCIAGIRTAQVQSQRVRKGACQPLVERQTAVVVETKGKVGAFIHAPVVDGIGVFARPIFHVHHT